MIWPTLVLVTFFALYMMPPTIIFIFHICSACFCQWIRYWVKCALQIKLFSFPCVRPRFHFLFLFSMVKPADHTSFWWCNLDPPFTILGRILAKSVYYWKKIIFMSSNRPSSIILFYYIINDFFINWIKVTCKLQY